ncbi:MAG: hypothetical protein HQ559_14570, partial [Lentisphaerae bacterium]|nr:hypothetical protein [Lentisphaerota bacterium]
PFEFHARRVDIEIWSIFEELTRQGAGSEYREMADAMIKTFVSRGFDRVSGLGFFATECDFDVVSLLPRATKSTPWIRFKPTAIGMWADQSMEQLWRLAPEQMTLMSAGSFRGLVSNPDNFDFNRYCGYGYPTGHRRPSLKPDTWHLGFPSAAFSLVRMWGAAFARTGHPKFRIWSERMIQKWSAVQHPESGLLPGSFYKAVPQVPEKSARSRDGALSASILVRAAGEFEKRPEGRELAAKMNEMAVRIALGTIKHTYDAGKRTFSGFVMLDGKPQKGSEWYTFRTREEKDAAVRKDPKMRQVPLYDGIGFYENGGYWRQCAGTYILPRSTFVAVRTGDKALLLQSAKLLEVAVEEFRKQTGAFTSQNKWTFSATGVYVQALCRLYEATGDARFLAWATELASGEIDRLEAVEYPHWWRLSERTDLLSGLLMLHSSLTGRRGR